MAFDQLAHLHHQKGTTPGFGPHPAVRHAARPVQPLRWGVTPRPRLEDAGCPFPEGATLHILIKVSYPPARGRACASVRPTQGLTRARK